MTKIVKARYHIREQNETYKYNVFQSISLLPFGQWWLMASF